jgi:replication-associated recombination protein RarA
MKELGYGEEYKYNMITLTILPEQEFLPDITKHLFMFLEIIQEKIPLGNF